jgi:type I restriction enzyme S subunit
VRLGDVAEIKFSNVNKHSVEGERVVRLCNYMDVFKNRYINDQMPFMTATATEHEIQKFTLHVGDVAITKDSETPDEIGIPALIDATASDLLLGYHLALLRPNKKILEPAFLVLLLESDLIRAHFQRSAKGLTRFALSVGAVTSTPIQLPTLLEQQAIARLYRNCVIEEGLLLKQRAAFAAQRRGLMEKLLSGEIDIQDPKETAA